MTVPNGVDGITPGLFYAVSTASAGYSIPTDGSIPGLTERTQPNIIEQLKERAKTMTSWQQSTADVWGVLGLRRGTEGNPVPLILGGLEKFANALLPGSGEAFADMAVLDAKLNTWSVELQNILGGFNPFDPDFDFDVAAANLVNLVIGPTGLIAILVGGVIDILNIPGIDASKIISGTFTNGFVPGLVSLINALFGSGTIGAFILNTMVPGLDASQIISGFFPQAQVSGLTADLASKVATTTQALVVPNANFATSLTDWNAYTYNGVTAVPVWDGTQGHTTLGSAKLIGNGTDTAGLANPLGGEWPAVPGQTYTVSVWVKWASLTNGTDAKLGIFAQDGAHNFMTTNMNYVPVGATGSGGWTQYSANFTVPADAVEFGVEFINKNTGTIWVDDVTITQTGVLAQPQTPSFLGELQRTMDAITSAFRVPGATGTSAPDAFTAMQSMFDQMVANTKNIQSLQSAALANTNAGKTVAVDFSNYADGNLPSIFTVIYSGSGTSTVGVTGGEAEWRNRVNDNDRAASIRYNVEPTDTDFQIVRGAMSQAPNDGGISGNPRIWARGRVNAADDSFVWARAYSVGWMTWRADIGCTVGGSETVWASNIPLTWSMDIYWKLGVGANARQYELWSGNKLVKTHTEVGTVSQLGASYRYWGARAEIRKGTISAVTSGKMGGSTVSDNSPATILGTHTHVYRTSGTNANLTGGSVWTRLPNSFFGNTLRQSTDLDVDLTQGRITVHKSKPYSINVRLRLSNTVSAIIYVGLYKNGVLEQVGDTPTYPNATAGLSIGGHYDTYGEPNDYFEIWTWQNGLTVGVLNGEATGAQSYLNVTGVGGTN